MRRKNVEFGNRFLEAFNHKSIPEIARKMGKSYQAIKNYIEGRVPTWEILVEISNSTGCSIHWLLTGAGEKNISGVSHSWQKKLASENQVEDTALVQPSKLFSAEHTLQPVPLIGTITADSQQIVRPQERPHVMVPGILVRAETVLFRIDGDELASEGLRDGDLVLVREAVEPFDSKIVLALIDGERVIIRRYFKFGTMVHFSAIEGDHPVIRFPAENVEVKYVVTSVTRAFE